MSKQASPPLLSHKTCDMIYSGCQARNYEFKIERRDKKSKKSQIKAKQKLEYLLFFAAG